MPRDVRTAGFSRRHRFTGQGSFGPILRASRKLRGRFAVIHAAPGIPGRSRLGIALTRRNVPSSVQRNRLKRLVREAFRTHPVKGAGLDLIVMLRERYEPRTEGEVILEVRALMDDLCARTAR